MKTVFFILYVSVCFLYFAGAQTSVDLKKDYGNNNSSGHYATLNGVKLYYEEYGTAEPLILIHGNGGNINYMTPQIDYFSKKYRVIAIDCRGRGKSELGKDSLTYMQMTRDLNSLLEYLKIDSTYIIGRSDGGIVALMMAIYFPDKVKKVAAFGANLTPGPDALYEFDSIISKRKHADDMLSKKDTTQNWYLVQQKNRMMEFQPQITKTDLQKIKCPVLVMTCDRDMIKEEHSLFIYRNIPKANLCVFPGETHKVTKQNPELFNQTVEKYFNEPFRGEEIRK